MKKIAVVLACSGWTLLSCGGGGGGGPATPPVGTPTGPALELVSAGGNAVREGGAPIALQLTGANSLSGPITWSIKPDIGSLAGTSATGATYIPPPEGQLVQNTTVTVAATPASGSAGRLLLSVSLVPFTVTAVSPVAGASAALAVAPAIQFSRPVAPGSVDAATVYLQGPVASVPTTPGVQAGSVVLAPTLDLTWGTAYTIAATVGVTSTAGQHLSTPFSSVFSTPPASWGAAGNISNSAMTGGLPHVGHDAAGNGLAVFEQDTNGTANWNVFFARFTAASQTWAAAAPVYSDPLNVGAAPLLAVDAAGNAIAAWQQSTATSPQILAARFIAATGIWSSPVQVNAGTDPSTLQLSMDAQGNAYLVSFATIAYSSTLGIAVSRFDASAGTWSAPASVAADVLINPSPQMAVTPGGDVMVVWLGQLHAVQAARYNTAQGWMGFGSLQGTNALTSQSPQVSRDGAGNAIALWSQLQSGGSWAVTTARFDATASTWGAPVLLQSGTGNGGLPQSVMDPAGNAIAIWEENFPASVYHLCWARYDHAAGTWSAPGVLEQVTAVTISSPYAWVPALAGDGAGNAMALWTRDDGTGAANGIYGSRYSASTSHWDPIAPVVSPSANLTGPLVLDADHSGNAFMLWDQNLPATSIGNVFAMRLTGP